MTVLAVIGNVFYYQLKHTLKVAGYKVNYFYGHFRDLPNMYNMIKREGNIQLQRKYRAQLIGVIISILLFLIVGVTSFMTLHSLA